MLVPYMPLGRPKSGAAFFEAPEQHRQASHERDCPQSPDASQTATHQTPSRNQRLQLPPTQIKAKAAKMPRRRPTIKFRTSFANTIYDVMTARGWKETDSDTDWDFHCAISASRRVEAPSLHSNASSPGMMEVGGFFFDFEAIQTVSSEYDAPRRGRARVGLRGF